MAFYIDNCIVAAKPSAAFKMGIKAAVIHINRSNGCGMVIRNKNL